MNVLIWLFNTNGEKMKTTLNINDSLLKKASTLLGITQKTTLVQMGLEALISMEGANRLSRLRGSEKEATLIKRRRLA